MDSSDQYQKSYDELRSIKKSISTDEVIIHFNRLDEMSANYIRQAIQQSVSRRLRDVSGEVQGSLEF